MTMVMASSAAMASSALLALSWDTFTSYGHHGGKQTFSQTLHTTLSRSELTPYIIVEEDLEIFTSAILGPGEWTYRAK